MSQRFASTVVAASLALALGTQLLVESTVGQEKSASKPTPTKVSKKLSGRLPPHYGKLGISSEQRTEIYGIQATYKKQITDLQKQIDELREKQGTEVTGVLTSDQKKKLTEHLTAAKKAAEARSSRKKSS
jgi:TolA-binding protein